MSVIYLLRRLQLLYYFASYFSTSVSVCHWKKLSQLYCSYLLTVDVDTGLCGLIWLTRYWLLLIVKIQIFFPWPRYVGVTRSRKHWFWFLFWWTLPVSAKEGKAYTNLQDQNIWKASLPHLRNVETTGVIPTGKQTSQTFLLPDKIVLLSIVSNFHSLESLVYLGFFVSLYIIHHH